MKRQKRWRVRVMRKVEDWVDVQADTAEQAEQQAQTLAGVISVFTKSAMSGEKPIGQIIHQNIEDDIE